MLILLSLYRLTMFNARKNVSDNKMKIAEENVLEWAGWKKFAEKMLKRLDLKLTILYNEFNKAADIVTKKTMKNRYTENVIGNMDGPPT